MADNFTANPGVGGAVFASDDVGGVQVPRVKLQHGVDGVAVDASGTDPLPITAAQLTLLVEAIRASNSVFTDGDKGMFILGKRRDADTTLVADSDYCGFNFDSVGRLKVASQPGDYPSVSQNITANAQRIAIDVTRISNLTVSMIAASLVGHNATFEYSPNSTNGVDGNWYGIQAVRTNANTIETATGVLAATPVYGWELSVNAYKWVSVRSTAHTSGTATYIFQPGTYATEPIPAAQVTATQPVSFTQPAQVAGTALMGDVGLQARANATGAATAAKVQSAASTNATVVKASAGRVMGWHLTNTSAAVKVVHLHNLTVAPTVGTSVPAYNIVLPAGATVNVSLPVGIAHATGISYSITGAITDLDNTAVAANEVVGAIYFA